MKKTIFLLTTIFILIPLTAMEPDQGKRRRTGDSNELTPTIESEVYKDCIFPLAVAPCPPEMGLAEELKITPNNLFRAIKDNNPDLCAWFIDQGADLNYRNTHNSTPLMLAVNRGYFEICRVLIEKGADINLQNSLGETAMMIAIRKGFLEICKLLIKNGANVNAQTATVMSSPLLHYATDHGQDKICELLLQHNANPNALDVRGMPALINCIINENCTDEKVYNCAKILLKYGADVNLLSTGVPIDYNPNAQNIGYTSLMAAISLGTCELCKLLIGYDADYGYQSHFGTSAMTEVASLSDMDSEENKKIRQLMHNPNEIRQAYFHEENPQLQQGFRGYSKDICTALLKREIGKK